MTIDATLFVPRRVIRIAELPDSLGYEVQLECGHAIWSVGYPDQSLFCGTCLEPLIRQIHDLQQQQKLPG